MQIRAITTADNMADISRLVEDTWHRFVPHAKGRFVAAESLKQDYVETEAGAGFVAEDGDRMAAFVGVTISRLTKNGLLVCGFTEDFPPQMLKQMTDRCAEFVSARGGSKLVIYANLRFGQVRNREITLWEQMGFEAEEFASVTAFLSLEHWKEPEAYKNTGIEHVSAAQVGAIQRMLLEDGEERMAEQIGYVRDSQRSPSEVILTLKAGKSAEIAGVAYYRVNLYKPTKESSGEFQASGFGLHFRPALAVSGAGKKRLLHAALLSMKQLDVKGVMTRMTLKHFDVFAALAAEGFNNHNLEDVNSIRLHKPVRPL